MDDTKSIHNFAIFFNILIFLFDIYHIDNILLQFSLIILVCDCAITVDMKLN